MDKTQRAQTCHIEACRRTFMMHLRLCAECLEYARSSAPDTYCCAGQVLFDAWANSIAANPSCEHVTATDTREATT